MFIKVLKQLAARYEQFPCRENVRWGNGRN
jgi:hypothetical protein